MSSKALDKTLTAMNLPPLGGSQLALVQPDGTVLGPDGKVIGRRVRVRFRVRVS